MDCIFPNITVNLDGLSDLEKIREVRRQLRLNSVALALQNNFIDHAMDSHDVLDACLDWVDVA